MILALFGQSIPNYVLGIALVLLFAVILGILPAAGRVSFSSLILPAVTLAAYPTARLARVVRSELLDILAQDYIRTARAKGLSARTILTRHALRNSLIPVVTILGMDLGFLLGGAIIVETVFAWPGVGSLVIQSVNNRDYPVVQASAFLMAAIFVVMNLLVDLLYSTLDPRVRYG
jgi:ABC-type dipeptide/oligopeptide/nickel transport system permease component